VDGIRTIKKEIDSLKIEAENAELRVDLARAAEIRYGALPNLNKDLQTKIADSLESKKILDSINQNTNFLY
jgi:ATP-dependent Clp protease ATP-binding subunit ClpB